MPSPGTSSASIVHLLGVDDVLADGLREHLEPALKLVCLADQDRLYHAFQDGRRPADTVLLGLELEDPVRVAQRIHAYDKQVPILILSAPSRCAQMKRTLMFSPFLGNEVAPWSMAELDELPAAIRDAVDRRRQRIRYLNTIANAQIRLEKLPLLQPDAGHYLDQLLDHAPIGVLTVDLAGAILTLNRQARETLGVDERAALGHSLAGLFPESEWERLTSLLTTSLGQMDRQAPQILEVHRPGRDARHVEVTPAPLAYRTGQRGSCSSSRT